MYITQNARYDNRHIWFLPINRINCPLSGVHAFLISYFDNLIIKTTTRWGKPFWLLPNDGFYYIIGFYNLFFNLLICHFCHIGMIKSMVTYQMSLFIYHFYYIFMFLCPLSFNEKSRFYILFF